MKKVFSMLLAVVLCVLLLCSCGKKEAPSVTVFVTIASEGELVFYENIPVTDADKDGVVSVSDAMACAHDAKFEGGAESGYLVEQTEYTLSLEKLWGVENGGSYGCYLNNAYIDTLLAPVAEGDIVSAFSYADLVGWTDVLSYFDRYTAKSGELTLTLSYLSYDENWNTVSLPGAGIELTIDGMPTGIFTDENGTATLTVEAGTKLISAVSDTLTLVPPVCIIEK